MRLCEVVADIYDPVNGIGAVPNNQSVDYFGFTVMMKPSMFLQLAKPLNRDHAGSVEHLKSAIQNGQRIGPPFLIINRSEDPVIPSEVKGHEGRNRMYAIQELYGDQPTLVHIFLGGGERARHITIDDINVMNTKLRAEHGQQMRGPFWSNPVHRP